MLVTGRRGSPFDGKDIGRHKRFVHIQIGKKIRRHGAGRAVETFPQALTDQDDLNAGTLGFQISGDSLIVGDNCQVPLPGKKFRQFKGSASGVKRDHVAIFHQPRCEFGNPGCLLDLFHSRNISECLSQYDTLRRSRATLVAAHDN